MSAGLFIYRTLQAAAVLGILYLVSSIWDIVRSDTSLIATYKAQIVDLKTENATLYTELTKLVDEREALKDEVYKLELQMRFLQRDRSF